jgi:hypothetical protein
MVFGDIHACRYRTTFRSHHRHVKRTLTRGSIGDPRSRNNRSRLAEEGGIALAVRLSAMGGCYARHWWRGDVLRKMCHGCTLRKK